MLARILVLIVDPRCSVSCGSPCANTPLSIRRSVTISTNYPGADAETSKAQITEPLEEAVNSVAGLPTLTIVRAARAPAQITVEFTVDTDLEAAASDVRDPIARLIRKLPTTPIRRSSRSPTPTPADLRTLVGSDRRSQLELGAYADTLKERLQTVPGVSRDNPAEKRYAMRLWIDPGNSRAYGLSPLDVRAAVPRENVELPSGRIEGRAIELAVKTDSRLDTPEEFNAIVIKRTGDRIVRFSDIGYAELGAQNDARPSSSATRRSRACTSSRSPARTDRDRRRTAPPARADPAGGARRHRGRGRVRQTEYVRRSMLEVTETILIAFVLVVLVVFAFFREWRTTLIPGDRDSRFDRRRVRRDGAAASRSTR